MLSTRKSIPKKVGWLRGRRANTGRPWKPEAARPRKNAGSWAAHRPAQFAVAVALALVPVAGCDITGPDDAGQIEALPRQLGASQQKVIQAGNAFAFDLLRAVVEEEGAKNVFLSPLSASYALGMALNGAEGETYRAMAETLHLKGLEIKEINASYSSLTDLLVGLDESVELGIANAVW